LHELFSGPLTAWRVTGDLQPRDGRLLFRAAGQQIEQTLPRAIAAGSVTITCVPTITKTRSAMLELEFMRGAKANLVQLEWCGPGEWVAVTGDTPEYTNRLRRTGTAQQLRIEFDHQNVTILVGTHVVWSGSGSPGALRCLRCRASGADTETATLSQITLTTPVQPATASWADLTNDALRTPHNSERFGSLQSLTALGVQLQTNPPSKPWAWSDIGEFTFRRESYPTKLTQGEHVQVRLRGAGMERDWLRGAVSAWEAQTLTVQHPILGELTLPRTHLVELRLEHYGAVLPLTTTPYHLGTRAAFGFAVPKPNGTSIAHTVMLDTVPDECTLLVEAAQVHPKGTPVAIIVNGKRVDTLNRHVDGPSPVARIVRVPLPRETLRSAKNEIELRLETKDNERATSVDLRSLRLEMVQPR
jgi:hypothetical protein